MNYTEDDLIDLIARHDEHEDYYRARLADLRRSGYADALEDLAGLIEPFSGIGLANGATRADVAEWIRKRAGAIREEARL